MPIATCLLNCFNTAVMELIRWPTNYMFTIMIFIKKYPLVSIEGIISM